MPRQNPKRRIPSMLWEKYIGQWWKVSQMSNFQIFELLSPTKGNQVQPWIGIWTIRAPQRTMVGCVPWDVTRILAPPSTSISGFSTRSANFVPPHGAMKIDWQSNMSPWLCGVSVSVSQTVQLSHKTATWCVLWILTPTHPVLPDECVVSRDLGI